MEIKQLIQIHQHLLKTSRCKCLPFQMQVWSFSFSLNNIENGLDCFFYSDHEDTCTSVSDSDAVYTILSLRVQIMMMMMKIASSIPKIRRKSWFLLKIYACQEEGGIESIALASDEVLQQNLMLPWSSPILQWKDQTYVQALGYELKCHCQMKSW